MRALLHHMIAGNHMVAPMFAGVVPDMTSERIGADPVAAYRGSAASAAAAFGAPGALDADLHHPIAGTVHGRTLLGFRMADQLVHAWDLARATGQPTDLPVDLCDAAVMITQERFGAAPRPAGLMAPAQEVAANASPADRMAAFLGRRV